MKNILILLLFCWSSSFGQSVPNRATFTIGHVMFAVYGDSAVGSNTATVFADSNAAYFDATYGSKTMSPQTINGFRNYGVPACTRPGGLTDMIFYSQVNGVAITDGASADYYTNNFSCQSTCVSFNGETLGGENDDVYAVWGATDCTKIGNHYYVMTTANGSSKWAVYVTSGVLHYVYL